MRLSLLISLLAVTFVDCRVLPDVGIAAAAEILEDPYPVSVLNDSEATTMRTILQYCFLIKKHLASTDQVYNSSAKFSSLRLEQERIKLSSAPILPRPISRYISW